jgi:hypothetical protein
VSEKTRERWAFLSGLDIGADGDPYLDRLRIIQTPLFGIYLHHIHRPDREPDPHDHPWWFASLVLAGWYEETVWADKRDGGKWIRRERPRGSARRISRRSAHRITGTCGPLWTLVLTGPKRSGWGFWRDGRYVPWRQYLSESAYGTTVGALLDGAAEALP